MQLNAFPVTQKEARQTGAEFSSEKNKNSLFPTRLRELRKEKGVSQQECADTLGVSKSTLGLWENGDTLPDARSLAQMAEYYGVSADYMLGVSEVKSPDVSTQKICELTGLTEQAVEMLMEIKERKANPEYVPVEGRSLNERRMLDALNQLIYYQPFLLANIGDYLFFDFDHYAIDDKEDNLIPIPGKLIYAVGDYADQHNHVIPISGLELADLKLIHIETDLKKLRSDIASGEKRTTIYHDFF